MEPIKPIHKTNTVALVIFAIVAIAIVALFLKTKANFEYNPYTTNQSQQDDKKTMQETNQTDVTEADIDSATSIDNSIDLQKIDSQF